MPAITQILRARLRRHKKYDTTFVRRSGLGFAIVISLFATLTFLTITAYFSFLAYNLPPIENLPLLLHPSNGLLLTPTRFYDRNGQHIIVELENPAIEERAYIPFQNSGESFPEELIDAILYNLDPNFWNHPGFNLTKRNEFPPQTLAQRLARDLLLWNEPAGRRRDLRELILAAQITHQYGREQVLEWYLNSAYFGNVVYGSASATEVYFGKPVNEINLTEAAILATVAASPTINPFDAPDVVIQRAHAIIEGMHEKGLISSKQFNSAQSFKPVFQEPVPPKDNIAPAFTNLVWEQLSPQIPFHRLERGGFIITTTLDYDLQYQVSCTTKIYLAELGGRTSQEDNCEAVRLLPGQTFSTSDTDKSLVANSVILDPSSGQILALVGETTPGLDPAHLPGHPPGSLLTPFVYLTAFTRGFNPASLLWDIPTLFSEDVNQVANPSGEFQGPIRLRQALANDYLVPALTTMIQIGAENVWRTINQFNISVTPQNITGNLISNCPNCQQLFSGSQVTLLEMVQAFGILSNQGTFIGQINVEDEGIQLESITILRVSDTHGVEWLADQTPEAQPVISAQLSYLMNHILSDESARWETLGHPNPLEIGRPVAAKLGKTSSGDDIWTIGYTPQLVVGIWMGNSAAVGETNLNPKIAAALWHAIMKYATRDMPADVWRAPLGINTMVVCDPSGMLPSADCPTVVSDVFLSGHEPTQVDTLYRKYEINRETGRLATVFTPPELIEEQIFMLVPPEANQWAHQVGLATPPETYDVIYSPNPSPEAQITSPQIFANLKGEVQIEGSAFGEGFISYRVQVGKGLNPQNWLAISDDITQPVINDTLTSWDTSALNGLYAIQLIVVREKQKVDTTTIQVTIDNLPPEISINYPEADQIFDYQPETAITFQLQASDNLGVAKIEYFLDDQLIEQQTQPPFAFPWEQTLGEHTLSIKVIDLAGNQTYQSITFQVDPPKH